MDDDDRPQGPLTGRGDAASLLSGEGLDTYSLDELDARIALLKAEIERVSGHRQQSSAHRLAADALFGSKPK